MSSTAAPFGLNPIGRFDTGSLEQLTYVVFSWVADLQIQILIS